MKKQKWTVVFDLDGSLETPYFKKEDSRKVRAWMEKHPCGYSFDRLYAEVMDGLPHFLLNGALELLRWVHDQGFEIVFFSNAVEERNRELCPIIMERAFGKGKEPAYRVLSRGDCVDTTRMNDKQGNALQGLWHGNYKKKLAGIVVPTRSLSNTLMIEDDNSYAARGEEQNFVYGVYGGCAHSFVSKPVLSVSSGQDFHLPFYFCGMLKRIVAYAKKKRVSLAAAAVQVQYADYGCMFPVDGRHFAKSDGGTVEVPVPPREDFRIFLEGLLELRAYNPKLAFWGDADEKGWGWPDPDRPVVKKVEKPKVKTDMTCTEADYWLGVLRQTLCAVVGDNVKHVGLRGKDFHSQASAHESHWVTLRERDFGGENYFDRKAITHLEISGYLPIREEKSEGREGGSYYYERHTRGEIRFESCMHVIQSFLRDSFRLEAGVNAIEISCEHWTIPVSPLKGLEC